MNKHYILEKLAEKVAESTTETKKPLTFREKVNKVMWGKTKPSDQDIMMTSFGMADPASAAMATGYFAGQKGNKNE